MNFNQVQIGGRFTRDPQLKYLANQTAVCEFGLATERKWKGKDGQDNKEVCFVDCVAWAGTAEAIARFGRKGLRAFISGYLKLEEWEDRNGGGKRSKLKIVVENYQVVDWPDDQQDQQPQRPQQGAPQRPQTGQRSAPPQRGPATQQRAPQGHGNDPVYGNGGMTDDEIPF